MKRTNQFASLFIVAGLSVLTIPALAQSSASSPGSNTKPGSGQQMPPPARPETPVDSSTGSSSSSSSSLVSPTDSTPRSSTTGVDSRGDTETSGVNDGSTIGVQGAHSFARLDADSDGRISLTEFTRASAQGASSASPRRNMSGSTDSSSTSGSAGSTDGRSAASTGVAGGSPMGENTAGEFQQLDRDRDGYISRSELTAAQGNSSGPIKE